MMLTVALTLCHLVTVEAPGFHGEDDIGNIRPEDQSDMYKAEDTHPADGVVPVTVCHEEIMFRGDGDMQACMVSQPAVADWKLKSEFADDGWTIARIRCIPGNYKPKDAI